MTAPIQVNGELAGLVVIPPPRRGGVLMTLRRWLSLPGTIVLVAGHDRSPRWSSSRRHGGACRRSSTRPNSWAAATSQARAPEEGVDEIARVAQAFNRMAHELAARERGAAHVGPAAAADARRRLARAQDAAHVHPRLHRDAADAGDRRRRRPARALLRTIEQETRRLDRIVSDLLDLARYENGVGALEPRVFSIERLFQQVAARHERDAEAASIDHHHAASTTRPTRSRADPHRHRPGHRQPRRQCAASHAGRRRDRR